MNDKISFRRKISACSNNPDDIITYSIALMMGVMFFDHTNSLVSICYFLAFAAWVFKWIQEKKVLLEWDSLGILLLIILANALLSSIFSYDVNYSFREFRGEIIKMVPLYFLVISNIKTNDALKKIIKAILAGALVMSAIGVVGYFTGLTMFRGRTISLYANESYTSLGFYLLITTCLLLGLIIHEENLKKKLAYLFMVIIHFSCILTTLTRSIWLGLFSAVVIASFFYRKKIILFFPVIILVFFIAFPTKFTSRFMTIFNFQNYAKPGGVLADRVQLWKSAASMIRDYPILGVGYGKRIFKKVYIKENYIRPEAVERRPMPNSHNLYLDMAVQLGIPGLFVFLLLLAVFFKETIATYKNATDPFSKGILWGCLVGVYELLQIGLTGNLFHDENSMYIIFLMAVAMRLQRGILQNYS